MSNGFRRGGHVDANAQKCKTQSTSLFYPSTLKPTEETCMWQTLCVRMAILGAQWLWVCQLSSSLDARPPL